MAYQALYRKWRPLVFSDVAAQEHVTESLRQQVRTDTLSHAYLFTGTRGTGKTTCAKILARAVNCEHSVDGDPCNECAACRGILNGSNMDVLEIDAASNNGVDNIREIREEVIYSPTAVKKRVYIIDEVHMLSTGAFNALLKTLEEPPEHVVFILATTEVHKVPATILSRCQRFDFKRITPEGILPRLFEIARGERIELREDAAYQIARLADGSMRDAVSIFDRCLSGAQVLDTDRIFSVMGLSRSDDVLSLLDAAAAEDLGTALKRFTALYDAGRDVGALFDEMMLLLRDALIVKEAPESAKELISPSHDFDDVCAFSNKYPTSRLLALTQILSEGVLRMQKSAIRRMDAELCIIRMCAKTEVPAAAAMTQPAAKTAAAPAREGRLQPAPAPKTAPEKTMEPSIPKPAEKPAERVAEKKTTAPSKPPAAPRSAAASSEFSWDQLLAALAGKVGPSVYAHLNLADAKLDGRTLCIFAPEGSCDFLNTPRVRESIADTAQGLLGERVVVKVDAGSLDVPDNPFDELLKNARLGGVDIEIN